MTKQFIARIMEDKARLLHRLAILLPALMALALVAGCQTDMMDSPSSPAAATDTNTPTAEVITLREGDVLKISFPANANLNTTQPVRRDGMISLQLVGEIKASGKTPKQLEKDLVDAYSTQLLSKEVTVEVQSSTFPVYVTGAVLRPGRIVSDHPLTAFAAIMEAGGFDYLRANLKKVSVIRQENGQGRKYIVDLKAVMDGTTGDTFQLRPGDTVFVPEKFTWF